MEKLEKQTNQIDSPKDASFRTTNRRYAMVTMIAIGSIAALMLLYALVVWHALRNEVAFPLGWIVNWIPGLFYLWALAQLRGLFSALAKSATSAQQKIAATLSRVGWALMLGAVTTVLPAINYFLNWPTRNGAFVAFFVPTLTLFLIGLALTVVAPLLTRAAALEAEARSLKSELDAFF